MQKSDLKIYYFTRSFRSPSLIFLFLISSSFCLLSSISIVFGQIENSACQCIEYWNCAARNGTPYTYCGISDSEVCCFFDDENSEAPSTTVNRNSSTSSTTRPIPISTTTVNNTTGNKPVQEKVASESVIDPVDTSLIVNEDERKALECGVPKMNVNLDGKAEFREWPWHVAILEVTDDLYICGGTLISANRVLTAGHCIANYLSPSSRRLKIRAGEFDVSNNNEPVPHVEILVSMMATHPRFNNATLVNDIAILGLARKVRYQDNIFPICLPPQGRKFNNQGKRCAVTGWGRRQERTVHSEVLKEVIVPIWENFACQNRLKRNFGANFKLPDTALCAGDTGMDACDGDGGGPLVCFDNGKWVQEGVISYGVGCGRPESPGVYSRVSSFVNWINQFI